MIRRAVVADPGWRLVVADADQMEPRVLAAISRDPGLMEVAGGESDLYQSRVRPRLLRRPRHRPSSPCSARSTARPPATASRTSPRSDAGSRRPWRTWTRRRARARRGGSCGPGWGVRARRRRGPTATTRRRRRASRPRGRGGADPAGGAGGRAQELGAGVRLVQLPCPGPVRPQLRRPGQRRRLGAAAARRAAPELCAGMAAELVFFQHDEVIVHCPERGGRRRSWRRSARRRNWRGGSTFGETPVRFPFTTAVVECYADAK